MDVSIPQGDTPPQSDGNVAPIDLTQNRIFMRLEGTQSATVSGGGGLLVWMLYILSHVHMYVHTYLYLCTYVVRALHTYIHNLSSGVLCLFDWLCRLLGPGSAKATVRPISLFLLIQFHICESTSCLHAHSTPIILVCYPLASSSSLHTYVVPGQTQNSGSGASWGMWSLTLCSIPLLQMQGQIQLTLSS